MGRVTGIGGVFIRASDPPALRAWYKKHLGIDVQSWGGSAFPWADASGRPVAGKTAWSIGTGVIVDKGMDVEDAPELSRLQHFGLNNLFSIPDYVNEIGGHLPGHDEIFYP